MGPQRPETRLPPGTGPRVWFSCDEKAKAGRWLKRRREGCVYLPRPGGLRSLD
jgi:hypothetical protein